MGISEIEPIVEELIGADAGAASGQGVSPGQLRLFELKEGLPTLVKVSLAFAAIGLVALVTAFIDFLQAFLSRTIGKLPGVGGLISGATTWARQVFTHKIGTLYSGVDQQIGHSFYQLARLGRLLGAVVLSTAYVVVAVAQVLQRVITHTNLAPVVAKVVKGVHAVTSQVTVVERKVVTVTKIVTKQGAVIPIRRVHALETEVKQLQTQTALLQKQVAAKAHPSTLTSAAEVTALGLAGLGANWVRCEGSRELGKATCGAGPNAMKDLLGMFASLALIADFQTLVKVGQEVTEGTTEFVQRVLRV